MQTRLKQHKAGTGTVFTKKYNVVDLIYFETFDKRKEAKARERQLKNWHKAWKWNLIRESNPNIETLVVN